MSETDFIPQHPGVAKVVEFAPGSFVNTPTDKRVGRFLTVRIRPGMPWDAEEKAEVLASAAYLLRQSYALAGVPYPEDWP